MKHSLLFLFTLFSSTLIYGFSEEHDPRDVKLISSFESSDIAKIGYISVLQSDGSRIECTGAIVSHKHVIVKAGCFDISGNATPEEIKKRGYKYRIIAKGSDVSLVTGYFGSIGPASKIYKPKAVRVMPDYEKHQVLCSGSEFYMTCTDFSDFYNVGLLEFEDHTFNDHFELMDQDEFEKIQEGTLILYGYRANAQSGDSHLWSDSIYYDKKGKWHFFATQSLDQALLAPTMADAFGSIVLYQDGNDSKIVGVQTGAVEQIINILFQTERRPEVTYLRGLIGKWLKETMKK